MKKIYDYKTKTVKVYPVNESAGTGYCLYIEDYDGNDVAQIIDLDDKLYATEDEAAENTYEAFKDYLTEFEPDVNLDGVVYDDEIEDGVEFTTEDGNRKWVVKIKNCENIEEPEVEVVDEAADDGRFLDIDEIEKLLHKAIDNDFLLYFSNGKKFACSAIHEKGEILDDICNGHPTLLPNGRIGLENEEYGKYEMENLIMDVDDISDTNDDLDAEVEEATYEAIDMDESKNESVTVRFSRFSSLFEGMDEISEKKEEETEETEEKSTEEEEVKTDDEEEKKEDDEEEKKDDEDKKDDDEEEVAEMEAVVLTVKKEDAEKCKEKLIEAGVAEEDIDIIEGEEDDEDSKVRVDVNSVMELKDYLSGRGINLEKEIGGKIVSDDEEEEEVKTDDEEEKKDDEEKGDEEEIDDFNFDELGDIFGAEEEA